MISVGEPFKISNNCFDPNSWSIVREVTGLPLKCDGHNNINGDAVRIDSSIAHLVALLNHLEYYTFACCSGLNKDHSERDIGAYIYFKDLKDEKWGRMSQIAFEAGFDNIEESAKTIRLNGSQNNKYNVWITFLRILEREIT